MTESGGPDGRTGHSTSTGNRRAAVLAGHRQDFDGARELLQDPAPAVRASALNALARMGRVGLADLDLALTDTDALVRSRACGVAATLSQDVDLRPCLSDGESSVAEVAAWALGERGPRSLPAVPDLVVMARTHDDALCREAAVAALGSIGDAAGLDVILAATKDRPAVRRRAVIALAAFEGPVVEAALSRALDDRDWQVRQAAEDLLADRSPPDH